MYVCVCVHTYTQVRVRVIVHSTSRTVVPSYRTKIHTDMKKLVC